MKTIVTLAGGVVTVTENAGVFSVNLVDNVSVGGGEAAGIVKVAGTASATLDAATGLKLAEALLNSHLPVAVAPLATVVESIVNTAVAALE